MLKRVGGHPSNRSELAPTLPLLESSRAELTEMHEPESPRITTVAEYLILAHESLGDEAAAGKYRAMLKDDRAAPARGLRRIAEILGTAGRLMPDDRWEQEACSCDT